MQISLILFVLGVVIVFGSFIYAAVNMGLSAKRFFDGTGDNFGNMFMGHIGAMIGMVIGGFIAAIGAFTGGWAIFQSYIIPFLQK
jgi:hypothetical protein